MRVPMKSRSSDFVISMAVSMLTATPISRDKANPMTMVVPRVLPNQYRIIQVIMVL